MTTPIDTAPVNTAPLRRLLAEQKASHYALDWKDLTQLLDEIDRLRAEVARLRLWLVAFAECAEAAERNAASDGTGMLVPFHQDFAGIKSNPALRRDLRWWAKACREAIEAAGGSVRRDVGPARRDDRDDAERENEPRWRLPDP